jgi:hypothetical protein
MTRSRNPACSITAPNDSAPSTSQTVVSMPAIPPLEKRSSTAGTPVLLENPVAIAAKIALIPVVTGLRPGSPTKAFTAAGCVKSARMPANSADPRIERNAGAFLIEKITSSRSGSRFQGVMLNAFSRAA